MSQGATQPEVSAVVGMWWSQGSNSMARGKPPWTGRAAGREGEGLFTRTLEQDWPRCDRGAGIDQ